MTAILREDPPEISVTAHQISPALDRIMRRCLEKDPEQRFQSAKDLSFALGALSGSDSSVASRIAPAASKVRPWVWAIAAVAAVLAAAATWLATRPSAATHRVQFAIPVHGEVSHVALSADGSGAAPVTDHFFAEGDQSHRWPVFLPDGNRFLFWSGNFSGSKDANAGAIYVGSLDQKEKRLVARAHSSFAFDSHHLYFENDERRLVQVPFDPEKATVAGDTLVIANTVGFQPSTYWTAISASMNGTLVYNASAGATLSVLTWMDRTGRQLGQIGEPAVECNPTLSPDGIRVAVDISDQRANNVDLWLESTTKGGNSRFTFDPAEEVVGVWSRDGTTVAYRSA